MPTKYGRHDGMGRDLQKNNDPPISKNFSNRALEDAIEEWLKLHRPAAPTKRTVAVPFLALVCWLHSRGYHFPVRRRAADALKTGKDSIDAAIAAAVHYGEITEKYETLESSAGKTRQMRLNRYRYLVPCRELEQLYQNVMLERRVA